MADEFDLEAFLPYLLNQAAEVSSLSFQKVYRDRYGMLRAEWRVLFHLGLYGALTAKEISARAKIHKTKISRAVYKLEGRRFVKRVKDSADRRVEHLHLTEKGKRAFEDLRGVAEGHERRLTDLLEAEEAEVLRRALRKLMQFPLSDTES
ncbi:MAG: MarR family winged helix-turn-helix transcriptional regulator [Pseudomonadota bacterium]